MNLIIVFGMLVLLTFSMSVWRLTVSNAFDMSRATVIVRSGGKNRKFAAIPTIHTPTNCLHLQLCAISVHTSTQAGYMCTDGQCCTERRSYERRSGTTFLFFGTWNGTSASEKFRNGNGTSFLNLGTFEYELKFL